MEVVRRAAMVKDVIVIAGGLVVMGWRVGDV